MAGAEQILVTGGTGFIGRYVVRRLLAQGARVRLLCRSEQKVRRLFGDQVEAVRGDLLDPATLQRACRHMQGVVHLGGLYRFGRRERAALLCVNQAGTDHLLQAAWDHRVERVAHVSSCSVLDYQRGPITERAFPLRVPRWQSYRHSKWLGEKCALDWAKRGLPVTIANPTAPLGAEDEAPTPTGQIIRDFLDGRFPFSTRTTMNFVDVAELALGILTVFEKGRVGERYLLGHHNVWLCDFLRVLERISGKPAPRHRLPWPAIALAGMGGELVGSSRICWETALHASKRTFFDFQKASTELGWHPTRALEASARDAVAWFQDRCSPTTSPATAEPVDANVPAS